MNVAIIIMVHQVRGSTQLMECRRLQMVLGLGDALVSVAYVKYVSVWAMKEWRRNPALSGFRPVSKQQ